MKRVGISMMCVAMALVSGCHRKSPQGQVAATVNGEEVTLEEINTELQASNVPRNADKKAAQREILQHVIDRKLLVGAAEDKKLDKSAEYLSTKRRSDELLLAQIYARQQLTAVPLPTDAQITSFMSEHANAFGQREQMILDQIRFAPPKDLKTLSGLQGDHSMEAVASHLTAMGINFSRGQAGMDSAQAPPQLLKLIAAQPTEPFVIPDRGQVTVNLVLSRKAIPMDPQQGKSAAVAAWRQEKFQELIAQQVDSLRAAAKISYQNGFTPPANAPGSTAPGKGAAPAQ